MAGYSTCLSGSDAKHLNLPKGLEIKNDGSLFVADYNNNRIMKFDNLGEGNEGIVVTFNELETPLDIKIRDNGLYFLDAYRIYKLLFTWFHINYFYIYFFKFNK